MVYVWCEGLLSARERDKCVISGDLREQSLQALIDKRRPLLYEGFRQSKTFDCRRIITPWVVCPPHQGCIRTRAFAILPDGSPYCNLHRVQQPVHASRITVCFCFFMQTTNGIWHGIPSFLRRQVPKCAIPVKHKTNDPTSSPHPTHLALLVQSSAQTFLISYITLSLVTDQQCKHHVSDKSYIPLVHTSTACKRDSLPTGHPRQVLSTLSHSIPSLSNLRTNMYRPQIILKKKLSLISLTSVSACLGAHCEPLA